MANTALAAFRVEYYGNYWCVWSGGVMTSVARVQDLVAILQGREPAQTKKPKAEIRHTETVEEFLARGGKISRAKPSSFDEFLNSLGEPPPRAPEDCRSPGDQRPVTEVPKISPGNPAFPSERAWKFGIGGGRLE